MVDGSLCLRGDSEMKALHLQRFLRLITHCISISDRKTIAIIIADWPKYLRDSFTQCGESPNCGEIRR